MPPVITQLPSPKTALTEDSAALYAQAWADFSPVLWNVARDERPTISSLVAVAHALRNQGNLASRRHAEHLEHSIGMTGAIHQALRAR